MPLEGHAAQEVRSAPLSCLCTLAISHIAPPKPPVKSRHPSQPYLDLSSLLTLNLSRWMIHPIACGGFPRPPQPTKPGQPTAPVPACHPSVCIFRQHFGGPEALLRQGVHKKMGWAVAFRWCSFTCPRAEDQVVPPTMTCILKVEGGD